MYFGVHPCTAIPPMNSKGEPKPPTAVRSQLPYIAAINCLFAEFDAKDFEDGKAGARAHIKALDPQPSAIVDSGGGYHCYWLLVAPFMLDSDEARARADRAQKGWVARVGSDDGAKDLARVLRIPGTHNFKEAYAPSFPEVRFMRADFERMFPFEELEALIPEAPPAKVRAPRRAAADSPQTGTAGDVDLGSIATAAANLKRLADWRRDEYMPWIETGMALSELGTLGFNLWEVWSRKSTKYRPGDCADKWATFTPGDGLTLRSLARWADEDDPPDDPPEDDGCGPDCPNRARAAHLRTIIHDQARELEQTKERNRFVADATSAAGIAAASKRLTYVELKKELDRVPIEERDPQQWVRIRPAYMATCTGQNRSTISRHIEEFRRAGWIDTEVRHTHDAEHDTWTSETYVRPLVDLSDPAAVVLPQKPRGKQACRNCGSGKINREVRIICEDCEHVEVHAPVPVNVDTPELQTANQEDEPAEAHAPCLDEHPEPADVLKCNVQHKGNDPSGASSELQSAIQTRQLPAAATSPPPEGDPHRPINATYRPPLTGRLRPK